jgi:hypothetical protein
VGIGLSEEEFPSPLMLQGNVYTTGAFDGTVDFDPGTGVKNLSAMGESDIFIQKLDAQGNFIWAKSFGGNDFDQSYSIAIDAESNVYSIGDFVEYCRF